MDDYSKTGPKSPSAAAKAREREMASKMREVLNLGDEQLLIATLENDYNVQRGTERFDAIVNAWRSGRQR